MIFTNSAQCKGMRIKSPNPLGQFFFQYGCVLFYWHGDVVKIKSLYFMIFVALKSW